MNRPPEALRIISCVALALAVSAGCSSGDDKGASTPASAVPSVDGVIVASFEETSGVGLDFVLLNGDGEAIYVLSPEMDGVAPSSSMVQNGEIARRPALLPMEDGQTLKFQLPEGLDSGSYDLCSTVDECIEIVVQ